MSNFISRFLFCFSQGDTQHPVHLTTLDFLVEYITNNLTWFSCNRIYFNFLHIFSLSLCLKVLKKIKSWKPYFEMWFLSFIYRGVYLSKPSDTVHHMCPQTNNKLFQVISVEKRLTFFFYPICSTPFGQTYGQMSHHWMKF